MKPRFFKREHWGWLVLFCVVSLLLHLGAGLTTRNFNFGLPSMVAPPPPAEVEVSLAPLPPKKTPPAPPAIKAKPAPKPAPTPAAPPIALPTIKPQPAQRDSPHPTAKPLIARLNPNRLPKPLPRGLISGQRNLPAAATPPPRLTPLPPPVPVPLPSIAPPLAETNLGKGGGGAGAPVLPSVKVPDAPVAPLPGMVAPNVPLTGGAGPGNGGGVGEGTGAAKGAGVGSSAGPLGINRGIPFGDITGLSKGGNPNGGGGGGGRHFRLSLQPENTDGTPPVHIVYVLDTSGSMVEGNKIVRAREALRKALSELRTDDTFNLVTFSSRAVQIFRTMSKVNNATISAANTNIDFLEPQGETNMSDALDLALAQSDVTHIFLMSDGEPTKGIIEYPDLLAHVRARNTHKVRIITLALGLGDTFQGISLLRDMAEQNNGTFDYINLKRQKSGAR